MRAAVCRRYGSPSVVAVEEVPRPAPGPRDVPVRVAASTVSAADSRLRAARFPAGLRLFARAMFGILAPRRRVLGTELSGTVEAVGAEVRGFAPGDRVVACPGGALGGHAEFARLRADAAIARRPEGLDLEEAAAIPFGGSMALHFLRDRAALRAGERLLVVGAAGAVGSSAVQVGRAIGAEVTGVASAGNAETLRVLGAAQLDYRAVPLADWPKGFDLVIDTVGAVAPAALAPVVRPGGRLVPVSADLPGMLGAGRLGRRASIRVITGAAPEKAEDRATLVGMAAEGRFRPLIGARVPLERIAEAHALADSGHKRGSVLVTMGD